MARTNQPQAACSAKAINLRNNRAKLAGGCLGSQTNSSSSSNSSLVDCSAKTHSLSSQAVVSLASQVSSRNKLVVVSLAAPARPPPGRRTGSLGKQALRIPLTLEAIPTLPRAEVAFLDKIRTHPRALREGCLETNQRHQAGYLVATMRAQTPTELLHLATTLHRIRRVVYLATSQPALHLSLGTTRTTKRGSLGITTLLTLQGAYSETSLRHHRSLAVTTTGPQACLETSNLNHNCSPSLLYNHCHSYH